MSKLVTQYRNINYAISKLKPLVGIWFVGLVMINPFFKLTSYQSSNHFILALIGFIIIIVYYCYKIKQLGVYRQWILDSPHLRRYIER